MDSQNSSKENVRALWPSKYFSVTATTYIATEAFTLVHFGGFTVENTCKKELITPKKLNTKTIMAPRIPTEYQRWAAALFSRFRADSE